MVMNEIENRMMRIAEKLERGLTEMQAVKEYEDEIAEEKRLYERVTKPQTNAGSRGRNMGVTLTPRKEGNRWSLKIDIPIDVLRKWIDDDKDLKQ